jgi:hypothetical protein
MTTRSKAPLMTVRSWPTAEFATAPEAGPLHPAPNCPDFRGIDVSSYSQANLNLVARQSNERPRRTLGYRTPAEIFSHTVALTG